MAAPAPVTPIAEGDVTARATLGVKKRSRKLMLPGFPQPTVTKKGCTGYTPTGAKNIYSGTKKEGTWR